MNEIMFNDQQIFSLKSGYNDDLEVMLCATDMMYIGKFLARVGIERVSPAYKMLQLQNQWRIKFRLIQKMNFYTLDLA